jgi:hypothetical protein
VIDFKQGSGDAAIFLFALGSLNKLESFAFRWDGLVEEIC